MVKTAAIAAPFESGKVLSLLMLTKVDVLTIQYRDANGGLRRRDCSDAQGPGGWCTDPIDRRGSARQPPAGTTAERREVAMVIRHSGFIRAIACGCIALLPAIAPAATKPPKLHATAIQVEAIDAGDVSIPAEFVWRSMNA